MSIANRLSAFGESCFATWSRIAIENDAINLGQGFPDFPAPEFIKEAAIKAIRDNENQYFVAPRYGPAPQDRQSPILHRELPARGYPLESLAVLALEY